VITQPQTPPTVTSSEQYGYIETGDTDPIITTTRDLPLKERRKKLKRKHVDPEPTPKFTGTTKTCSKKN
jgi:hypothetical protein